MEDRTNNLTHLEFDITHLCNKYCDLCSHRVKTSKYKYLTGEEYKYIVSCIEKPEDIKMITVIGGEPLLHPNIEWLMESMQRDFPQADIFINTNGKLLSKFYSKLKVNFSLTEYPGWNDAIMAAYRGKPRIFVFPTGGKFYNPYVDPNFGKELAQTAREKCMLNIRIIGTKLYNCCLAEPIEREHSVGKVHIEFGKDWKEKLYKLPTWKACRHCFRALDILLHGTMYVERTFKHDDVYDRPEDRDSKSP